MRNLLVLVVSLFVVACGPGEEGPPGPKGDPGPGVNSTRLYVCSGFIDMTGTGSGMAATHAAWVFPDGGVMTTCLGEGGDLQSSTTALFRSKDGGAAQARCAFTFDLFGTATEGLWTFAMSATKALTQVTYQDREMPQGVRQWSLPCQEQ